jgi:hypothetical protein
MSQAGKTTPSSKSVKANRISILAKRAGRLAEKNRKKGYH